MSGALPEPGSESESNVSSGGLSTHDAVLAAIPGWLCLAAVAGLVLSLSVGTTLAAGAVPAVGTVGYALFYNPPGREIGASGP